MKAKFDSVRAPAISLRRNAISAVAKPARKVINTWSQFGSNQYRRYIMALSLCLVSVPGYVVSHAYPDLLRSVASAGFAIASGECWVMSAVLSRYADQNAGCFNIWAAVLAVLSGVCLLP